VLALVPNLTRAAFRAPVEVPTAIPSATPPPVLTTAKVPNV
jgi:hypothetical protein